MGHAKYFSLAIALMLALYGAIGFHFLPLASFEGDLTRMAMLPETLFGWRKAQPAIDAGLMEQASWQEADVLVVGDSFSDPRLWQTALTRRGLHVRTESWGNIHAICKDFEPWLDRMGFRGAVVIFESVERNVSYYLDKSVQCAQMSYRSEVQTDMPKRPPQTLTNREQKTYSGRLSVGIRTAMNAGEYERWRQTGAAKTMPLNNARLIHMENGCALFSHSRCNDVLFYDEDQAEDISESVLHDMVEINTRLSRVRPLWVVVPNKTTVYLYPGKQFWNRVSHRIRTPDLLYAFRTAIENGTVDLYYGNDTHLSTSGYLLMGETVYQHFPSGLQ